MCVCVLCMWGVAIVLRPPVTVGYFCKRWHWRTLRMSNICSESGAYWPGSALRDIAGASVLHTCVGARISAKAFITPASPPRPPLPCAPAPS